MLNMFDDIITMRFQTLYRPPQFLVSFNKPRYRIRIRSNTAVTVQTFSILVKTNESGDSPVSKKTSGSSARKRKTPNQLFSEVNTIGIIGGASTVSTLNFLEKLVSWTSKQGEETLPFLVCNDPVLSNELLLYDRSSSPNLNTKNYRAKFDPTPVLESLTRKKVFLERAGAQCIVMPCHILHAWHDEISKGSSVPFIHLGDCVAAELKEANLKPFETGSNLKIGVLATDATLEAGFYEEKLQNQGFEVVLPDKATMEHTVLPAMVALGRKDMEGARNLFRIALQVLLVRGVNTVIIASDEMLALLPGDDPLLKKCINPMDALVRSTIRWAQTTVKEHKRT